MKITDKKQLVKLVSFLAMGDGSIHHNGGSKNCVFSMTQTSDHPDFMEWVGGVLGNITSCRTYLQEREPPRKDVIKVQTLSHPFFNKMRDRIYRGTYKSLDYHALKMLDWEALAILYMCDGCLGKNSGRENSFTTTLNLCRLSYGDMLLLKQALRDKLGLEWNIVKTGRKYFTLRLRMKDFDKFMYGIEPYVFDSFRYKLYLRTTNPSQEGDEIV